MVNNYFNKIKDYLLSHNLLEESDWEEVISKAEKNNQDIEQILIADKFFTSKDFNDLKAKIFDLLPAEINETELLPEVIALLPQKVAENYRMIVLDFTGNKITVGLVDPGNFLAHEAVDFLAKQNNWKIEFRTLALEDFERLIKKYNAPKRELSDALESAEEKFAIQSDIKVVEEEKNKDEKYKSAPVAKIVSVIIRNAIEGKASDIHIEPGRNESRVRYRVDGVLHTSLNIPNYLHNAIISRIKVLANLRLDETRLPQDGRIRMTFDNYDIDLRISVLPMLNSEKAVIRVLDTSAGVATLEELGFSDFHIGVIKNNIKKPFGVFLLTGPTGSGKTTTLYSILNLIKGDDINITTLEDPIEYYIQGINQSQINMEVGFSFADGLRAILRQDPNVIMVGEIRDNETAELVVHAGLTGHLVFSTLHTNNAWGAIPRLVDMKSEAFLLASTLNLVMAQRLVRKICPHCRQEEAIPPALLEKIKDQLTLIPAEYLPDDSRNLKFYHGTGCASCSNSGYLGRTVIAEILEVGKDLRGLIAKENFDAKIIQEQFVKQKFLNLMQDGLIKALKGETSIDEVMRVIEN